MAVTANYHLDNPPVDACFGTVADLFALFRSATSITLDGTIVGVNKGATEPSVDDTDKAWLMTDESGHAIAWYSFYNGKWRPVPRADVFDIKWMNIAIPDIALFDGTGKGNIDTIMDGWALANGQNGTPDLRNFFVVGAGDTYAPLDTGGEDEHVLIIDELPAHTHSYVGVTPIFSDTGAGPNPNAVVSRTPLSGTTGSVGLDAAHNNLPPYVALVPLMYIGY